MGASVSRTVKFLMIGANVSQFNYSDLADRGSIIPVPLISGFCLAMASNRLIRIGVYSHKTKIIINQTPANNNCLTGKFSLQQFGNKQTALSMVRSEVTVQVAKTVRN